MPCASQPSVASLPTRVPEPAAKALQEPFGPVIGWRTHALGLSALLAGVAVSAAKLEARPLFSATGAQALSVGLWSLALHAALLLAARLCRGDSRSLARDYFRALCLLLFSAATFAIYFTPNRVGPIDASWYGNVTEDFLEQARAGTFPVLTGTTVHTFNGAVHPFRSAPWQFVLVEAFDLLTARTLPAFALEHLVAIASYCAAVLVLFVGLSRWKPRSKTAAFLIALAYATSPSVTASFFQHDMYMTLTAEPVMIAALLCALRACDDSSLVAHGWLGVWCAALWYCHPPMAMLTGMVVAFVMACHLALSGLTPKKTAWAALTLAIFAALAGPYFMSMSEIVPPDPDTFSDVVAPAAGLVLLAFFGGGMLRTGSVRWLAVLAVAILCLQYFDAPLVPFAGCFSVFVCAAAVLGRWFPGLKDQARTYPLFFGLGLAAALSAITFFARVSLPDKSYIGSMVEISASNWRHFFVPNQRLRGIVDQPGYLNWLLLVGLTASLAGLRSSFARIGTAAALILVCALGIMGTLSHFLWLNCPQQLFTVFGVAYDLRLLPALAPVIAVSAFVGMAQIGEEHPRLARGLAFSLALLGPWTLYQHGVIVSQTANYRYGAADTAQRLRTENLQLERYSWDLVNEPRFFSNGVMDPALETRLWKLGDPIHPAIDPDRIEEALRAPGQKPVALKATPIPTGPEWLILSPTIELDPGQHLLVHFDFLGKVPDGWLIVGGQSIYREYILPSSGNPLSFGSTARSSHTLSLWNSGTTHESLELRIKRPIDQRDTPADPYCLAYLTPYVPSRAPVELLSLMPVHLRVNAPVPGLLETFRSYIPGYKVYVDGKATKVLNSDHLVAVRIEKGEHDVRVRFAGTVALHTATRWALTAWIIAGAALLVQVTLACTSRRRRA